MSQGTPGSMRPRARPPLVGRDGDRAALLQAIDAARMVTLTGPPGVGKTALAEASVDEAAARMGGRAIVVRLEAAKSESALRDAVASAAARGGGSGEDVIALLSSLGPTLLVLDPADRFAVDPGWGDRVTEWLDACPELSVVLVAQARAHLPGERVVELGVLDEPAALALFLALAAAQRAPTGPLGDDDREAARQIVVALDRLPLALELAATRLGVMTLPALAHRLKNRWELLRRTGRGNDARGSEGGLARHDTLELAIGWSIELLEPPMRALLEEVAVFRGGFSLEVAEVVLSAPASSTVLDGLLHLRERSLLLVEEPLPGEVRLRMLESVRQLAERGLDAARTAALEERHAQAYVSAAEAWAHDVELVGSEEARARLTLEHDNLAIVVERILGRGPVSARAADRALRVLCALGSVLGREGASALVRAHLESAIAVAQGSGADPRLLARALLLRGTLRAQRGAMADGERDLGEALVLANHSDDRAIEARVLIAAATITLDGEMGAPIEPARLAASRAMIARARALCDVSHDHALTPYVTLADARLDLKEGALARARVGLDEVLAEARRTGDLSLAARAELERARLALYEGRDAAVSADEALRLAEVLKDRALGSDAALLRGIAEARAGGDPEPYLEAALLLGERTGQRPVIARATVARALGAASKDEHGEARAMLRRVSLRDVDPDLEVAATWVLDRIAQQTGEPASPVRPARSPADPALAAWCGMPPSGAPTLAPSVLLGGALGGAPARPAAPPERLRRSERPASRTLTIDPSASAFALDDGPTVDLSRRKPLRRLLLHLCQHAAGASATPAPWDALLPVGWPGEKMRADAGAHRVRVAISTLRKMGLSGVLETSEDGYRVHASVTVVIEGEAR